MSDPKEVARVSARDLSVGDIIRTTYGDIRIVTRLESFDDPDAPPIEANEVGYMPVDFAPVERDHVRGVCHGSIIDAVARGDYLNVKPNPDAIRWDTVVSDVETAKRKIRATLSDVANTYGDDVADAALDEVIDERDFATYTCPNGHRVTPPKRPDDFVPEPDRHGNIRVTLKCGRCGERGTITTPKVGTDLVPTGWDRIDAD